VKGVLTLNLCLSILNLSQSSIVVTGVPTKSYRLPSNWIKPFTTVVNVASFKNVDEDEILQIEGVSKLCFV
jgi:methylenetetrahydrofolate dehydrogenase (NAD+)